MVKETCKDNKEPSTEGNKESLPSHAVQVKETTEGHGQHGEAEEEAKPIGKHIGEVETMPNIVRKTENATENKEKQEQTVEQAISLVEELVTQVAKG